MWGESSLKKTDQFLGRACGSGKGSGDVVRLGQSVTDTNPPWLRMLRISCLPSTTDGVVVGEE